MASRAEPRPVANSEERPAFMPPGAAPRMTMRPPDRMPRTLRELLGL
jgi:hypothetical protein